MKKLVQGFPTQLKDALQIGKSYKFRTENKSFRNVVITGLGGSGIGGSIIQNYVFDKLTIPLVVNKDYFIPSFVDAHSLVIVCSYSGNTEETIAAMEQAIAAKATIMSITSGGKIAEISAANGYDCILVPSGMPPRACLGFSMTQILFVLHHFGLISSDFETEYTGAIQMLEHNQAEIVKIANEITERIGNKLPIIYSAPNYEGVAIRFRQQINENSKMLCWHAVIPEMNHNELVGWKSDASDKVVIILRNDDDYSRTQTRMEINKKVITQYNADIIEIYSKGNCYWEKAIYLIHLTDWISVLIAEAKNIDAVEVSVIDFLKSSLAKS